MINALNPDLNNDYLLMLQVGQGNKGAFNLLFKKYWEMAYSTAYKRLRDADQAKDIIQDVFAHIWFNKDTLHINNIPAYLNRSIRNKVIKIAAKQKTVHPFFNLLDVLAQEGNGADSPLLQKEFFRSCEALLDTLPPQRQTIFRLRFQDDLPTKEIAGLLGLSRKTVQNQLGKAIQKLRLSMMHLWTLFFMAFSIF
jgi:RNA polymerase sigma factor (sigma-70 family)